jgi:hypothetical protein
MNMTHVTPILIMGVPPKHHRDHTGTPTHSHVINKL